MKFAVKIDGVKPILAKIAQLEDRKKRTAVLRKALRAAAAVVNKTARRLVQRESGTLKKSLAIKVKVFRATGVVVAIVGPRTKFAVVVDGRKKQPSKYAHFAHDGRHGRGRLRKLRRLTNRKRGSKFLARAVKSAATQARAAMAKKADEELQKLWRYLE